MTIIPQAGFGQGFTKSRQAPADCNNLKNIFTAISLKRSFPDVGLKKDFPGVNYRLRPHQPQEELPWCRQPGARVRIHPRLHHPRGRLQDDSWCRQPRLERLPRRDDSQVYRGVSLMSRKTSKRRHPPRKTSKGIRTLPDQVLFPVSPSPSPEDSKPSTLSRRTPTKVFVPCIAQSSIQCSIPSSLGSSPVSSNPTRQ